MGFVWDVHSIELKAVSNSAASLLSRKLKRLPSAVCSSLILFSCLGSNVELCVLETVTSIDDGLLSSLEVAQKEGLVDIVGSVYSFSHEIIARSAFNLISDANRSALLQQVVSCLIPKCLEVREEEDALPSLLLQSALNTVVLLIQGRIGYVISRRISIRDSQCDQQDWTGRCNERSYPIPALCSIEPGGKLPSASNFTRTCLSHSP